MSDGHEQWQDIAFVPKHWWVPAERGAMWEFAAPPAVQEMQDHRIKIVLRSSAILNAKEAT